MKMFRHYQLSFVIFASGLIILPLICVIIYAFSTINHLYVNNISLTLEHFKLAFSNEYISAILLSLKLALYTTVLCLVIGYVAAILITRLNRRFQTIMLMLCIIPMWTNVLLRTYAWKSIFTYNGLLNQFLDLIHLERVDLLNTEIAVLIGMVYNFLPFMILPIFNAIKRIDQNIVHAAKDLGATKLSLFNKIILPLSIPGIVSGIIFVFIPSATSFTIPLYLGGGKVNLIGNIIEQQFLTVGNWNLGSALSIIILVILTISTLSLHRLEKKYEKVI